METIVDSTYKTKSGALNKARALQFCLEEDKNFLNDEDWIVHLDEETLLTESSIRGILNFITAGKHSFGQGMNKSAFQKAQLEMEQFGEQGDTLLGGTDST